MYRSVGTLRGGGEAMVAFFDDSVSGYHELRPACDRWLMLDFLYRHHLATACSLLQFKSPVMVPRRRLTQHVQ